nr:hypothetical protein [Tanacetum cinerariifolium]
MTPKCWPAYCRIIRKGTGGRVGKLGRGIRKPKRGNVGQVDVFVLPIQKKIMAYGAGESDLGLGDVVGSGERSKKWEKVGFSSWREILCVAQ